MRKLAQFTLVAAFLFLAVRQLNFVNRVSVNMLYGDQWDFYQPMFEHQSWWATFIHQHGPHRQGAGFLITRVLAEISGVNTRWDSFAACGLLIGAAGLGLLLARRFGIPSYSLALVAVPLIFLNVHQYEIFSGPTNLSHGAMPMLLFMAYCLAWFIPVFTRRLVALTVLTFLLIFTGFGIFVGLITPCLLALEGAQAWRAGDRNRAGWCAAMLTLVGVSWAVFAHGYTFQPAVPNFRFPYEHPAQYFVFVSRMLGNFFGLGALNAVQLGGGAVIAALVLAITIDHGVRCVRGGVALAPRSAVLFSLGAYVLIYCANTAIGRVFLAPDAPLAPRYVTLVAPAALAIFLQIALLRSAAARQWLGYGFAALLIPATAYLRADERASAAWFTAGRTIWKATYLRTHREDEANRVAGFSVYPAPLGERLDWVEAHHWNLFRPERSP